MVCIKEQITRTLILKYKENSAVCQDKPIHAVPIMVVLDGSISL
jgi:hypothetical protein